MCLIIDEEMVKRKMKRKKTFAVLLCTALAAAASAALLLTGCGTNGPKRPKLFNDTLPAVEPDSGTHVSVAAGGEPNVIYKPPVDGSGYRYGPSIMYYADGSCDAWFSTPGYGGEWDWITVKHSDDGIHFGSEKVVLVPTPDSMDKFSCCDPGVIYFGGYYYLGYTSTIVEGGVNNNVFVARSRNAAGPYEKWNGSGWGGDPAPVVYYDEGDTIYGAGEPSMVVRDGVLYFYYTWACPDGEFIKVATSDTAEDWPARLTYRGDAYEKINSQNSCDVTYLEDAGKFVAFTTQFRFAENSGLVLLESEDGITFRHTQYLCEGLYKHLHSLGVSKRPDGHIQLKDKIFVGYAFSDGDGLNWGKWATAFQHLELALYKGEPQPEGNGRLGVRCGEWLTERPADPPMIAIATHPRVIELFAEEVDANIGGLVWLDPMLSAHEIKDTSKLKFSGYDKSLISIKKGRISSNGSTGETTVKVRYNGLETELKVYVRSSVSEFQGSSTKKVVEFTPVISEYELTAGQTHKPQIRGLVRFSDNTWAEAYNSDKMVSAKRFPVTYTVSDESVIKVNDRGIITPKAPGTAEVTVTIAGEKSFVVKVKVN